MCVEGCEETVRANLTRRNVLEGTLALAAGALAGGCQSARREAAAASDPPAFPAFREVVDLTHVYSARFPHFRGQNARVELEDLFTTAAGDGWNVKLWTLDEHAGTHVDAPYHRDGRGLTVDRIPARDLVLPLVVIDIRAKAAADPDAELDLDDVRRWEAAHGPLPPRSCVALLSGWESRVETPGFINIDDEGVRHFPGFHVEAVEYFLTERDVTAIAVDTASLDRGRTSDFPVHTRWLGAGRWGLENAARLADCPPRGATLCCGAPKIAGATGGPSRVFALV